MRTEKVIETADVPPKTSASGKPRRGRPSNASKQRETVEHALGAMAGAYSLVAQFALLTGRENLREHVVGSVEQLQASNRVAFEASPRLAAVVAGAGTGTGVLGFFVSNVVFVAGCLVSMRRDAAAKVSARESTDDA